MSAINWIIFRSLNICLLALVINTALLMGQSVYSGDYQLGPLRGEAMFSYQLDNGDTIFDGSFQLERGDLDPAVDEDSYFLVQGNYTDDIPHGAWTFKFGQLRPTGSISLDDNQYQVRLDGILHQAQGELVQGQYQDTWIHEVHQIQNSQPGEQLFRSEVRFEAGIPQLAIQIEDSDNVLLGRFLRNGLAHDVWTLYTNKEQSEHWHFRDGRLEKISIQVSDGDGDIDVFPPFEGPSIVMNLDHRYLSLLDVLLQLTGKDHSLIDGAAANLILKNSQYYSKVQELLCSKKSYPMPVSFQVEVPHEPFTEEQLRDMEQIRSNVLLIDSLSQITISSSSINIAKVADEDISYWQAIISSLSSEYLQPVRTLVQYLDREILDFIPKQSLWTFLWPDAQVTNRLELQYEVLGSEINRSYKVPDSLPIISGETRSIVQITTSVLNQIDSISRLIDTKVQSVGDQDLFAEVEEKLIEEVRALNGILDSAQADGLQSKALARIQSQATEELSKYSALVDIKAKQIQGTNSLNCLTHLRGLAQQVVLIPVRWELIQVEYTDKVWNNFTSTVMSEEVKRRITRSYRDIVVPHFLQRVIDDLTCVNVPELEQAFEQAYQRVTELRYEDTSKLERKLKNENDPKAVLEILGLDRPNPVKS